MYVANLIVITKKKKEILEIKNFKNIQCKKFLNDTLENIYLMQRDGKGGIEAQRKERYVENKK